MLRALSLQVLHWSLLLVPAVGQLAAASGLALAGCHAGDLTYQGNMLDSTMFHAQLFANQAWSVTSGPHPQLCIALCADTGEARQCGKSKGGAS